MLPSLVRIVPLLIAVNGLFLFLFTYTSPVTRLNQPSISSSVLSESGQDWASSGNGIRRRTLASSGAGLNATSPSQNAPSKQSIPSQPPSEIGAQVPNGLTVAGLSMSLRGQMEAFEAMQKTRRSRLKEACHKRYGSSAHSQPFSSQHLIYLKNDKIVWCPVFKAGTSTWLHNLVNIASAPEDLKRKLREKYPHSPMDIIKPLRTSLTSRGYDDLVKSNKSHKSFIIVRHPFYRLISAYRDKLERLHGDVLEKDWYFKVYGRKMTSLYRKGALEKFGSLFFSAKNNYGAAVPLSSNSKRVPELPIFWEFAQYLIKTRGLRPDEHWTPASAYCSPCRVQYDTVIKFESFDVEDAMLKHYLSNRTNWNAEWRNPNDHHGLSDDELTRKYFEQLSEDDVLALYKIYELDFKLFGYEFQFGNLRLPLTSKS